MSKGEVDQIIASSMREEIKPNSLQTFVGIAERCLNDEPKNRPTMSEVVLQLVFALKQQESSQILALTEIASVSDDIHPSTLNIGTDLPSAAQPTFTTTNMQGPTLPLVEQTSGQAENAEVSSGRRQWTKFSTIKILRFWPWLAFRKRSKRSKKNEVLFSDPVVESLRYDFARIEAATNYLASVNKLGEGGFGPVYKGKLLNGQEIAVKRLSSSSNQGNTEFENELLLLVRLQHRNLVRLLGFCLEGDEKLLVYEFVHNSSLDRFIFDPIKHSCLDWDQFYKIIRGTAMGLLYLHEGSRIRIIHRDLKASNVLLDGDFNPKVADFGLARVLSEADDNPNTMRVVGTYGYMAPEYTMNGQFSVKSDVFSFGVLVLEIISGRKNKTIWNGEKGEDLSILAWTNWPQGTAANMIDPMLRGSNGSVEDMLRCTPVGLLCIQESPSRRPTMASITRMLNASTMTLPEPSEPAYFREGFISEEYHPPTMNYRYVEAAMSKNEMSVTDLSPR